MPLNSIQVASGFDQTLTSSDNIESLTPTGGSPQQRNVPGVGLVYFYVNGDPQFSEGQRRISADAGVSFAGFEQVRYTQSFMHADSLAWLRDNYRGQVTANLRTDGTTYANYNCRLDFEIAERFANNWRRVVWAFTIIEAI
jgi:hypothetical protein